MGIRELGNVLGNPLAMPRIAVSTPISIPFRVLNSVDITVSANTTTTYPLGFTVKDAKRVTARISFSGIGYSSAVISPMEFFLGGVSNSFSPHIRVISDANNLAIEFGINAATYEHLNVSANTVGADIVITITEYDFKYDSFEALDSMSTVVNGADYTLAKEISDPSTAIMVVYTTSATVYAGVSQTFIKKYSSNVAAISLPYAGGSTGFCASLKDKSTVRYANWSNSPGNNSFRAFIYGGVKV